MKFNEAVVKLANSEYDGVMTHITGTKIYSGWSMASSAMRLYIPRDIEKLPESGWVVRFIVSTSTER